MDPPEYITYHGLLFISTQARLVKYYSLPASQSATNIRTARIPTNSQSRRQECVNLTYFSVLAPCRITDHRPNRAKCQPSNNRVHAEPKTVSHATTRPPATHVNLAHMQTHTFSRASSPRPSLHSFTAVTAVCNVRHNHGGGDTTQRHSLFIV